MSAWPTEIRATAPPPSTFASSASAATSTVSWPAAAPRPPRQASGEPDCGADPSGVDAALLRGRTMERYLADVCAADPACGRLLYVGTAEDLALLEGGGVLGLALRRALRASGADAALDAAADAAPYSGVPALAALCAPGGGPPLAALEQAAATYWRLALLGGAAALDVCGVNERLVIDAAPPGDATCQCLPDASCAQVQRDDPLVLGLLITVVALLAVGVTLSALRLRGDAAVDARALQKAAAPPPPPPRGGEAEPLMSAAEPHVQSMWG